MRKLRTLMVAGIMACFIMPMTATAAGPTRDPDSFVHKAAVALCTVGLLPVSYCGKLKTSRKR